MKSKAAAVSGVGYVLTQLNREKMSLPNPIPNPNSGPKPKLICFYHIQVALGWVWGNVQGYVKKKNVWNPDTSTTSFPTHLHCVPL